MRKSFRRFISAISAFVIAVAAMPTVTLPTFAEINTTKSSTSTSTAELLNGDVNKDGVIDNNDVNALSQAIDQKVTSSLVNADVNGDGKIDNSDVAMITSYVKSEIKYFPVGKIYKEGQTYITRAEWIHKLVTIFKMSVENKSSIVEYFDDIDKNPYKDDINLAANYGVFDIDSDEFKPDSFVTREFLSYTLNFCLGFKNENNLSCSDLSDIYYKDDVAVALEKDWFSLIDKEFLPDLYALDSEVTPILKFTQDIVDGSSIDPDHNDVVKFNDDVLRLSKNIKVNSDKENGTLTICSDTVSLTSGSVFT